MSVCVCVSRVYKGQEKGLYSRELPIYKYTDTYMSVRICTYTHICMYTYIHEKDI